MINSQELRFNPRTEEKLARKIDSVITILDDLTVYEKYFVLGNLYFVFLDTCQKEGGNFKQKRGKWETIID